MECGEFIGSLEKFFWQVGYFCVYGIKNFSLWIKKKADMGIRRIKKEFLS